MSLPSLPNQIETKIKIQDTSEYKTLKQKSRQLFRIEFEQKRIGNHLCDYFCSLSYQLMKFNQFSIDFRKDRDTDLFEMPSQLTFDDLKDISRGDLDFPTDEQDYTRFLNYSQWERSTNVLFGITPVISRVLNDVFPNIIKDKTVTNEIVVHLRMSDSPFCRHTSYHFMNASFYENALLLIQNKSEQRQNFNIKLICNKSHKMNPQFDKAWYAYLLKFTKFFKSHALVDKVTVVSNGILTDDFREMLHAKYLISSGSSMSTVAAMGKHFIDGSLSVFPWPTYFNQHRKSKIPRNIMFLKNCRVYHKDVPDYNNVQAVWKNMGFVE